MTTTTPVQYRGLRAFCAAARAASFKAAADELCVTASAVSHQIRDLESYLGVQLFERRTRAIELTAPGRRFFEEISPHLLAVDHAASRLRREPERAVLRVQMPEFFASELFVPRVAGFSDLHPWIDLRIETLDPGADASPAADLCIVLTRKAPPFDNATPLFPIRYVPACSACDFARLGSLGDGALTDATLLVHKARPQAWERWAEQAGVSPAQPRNVIQLDSMFALLRATEQGLGIGLVPLPVSAGWFTSRAVSRLMDTALVTTDYYHVVSNRVIDPDSATGLLWRWIENTFTDFG